MYNQKYYYYKDDRGFFIPFVVGGLLGGALATTWPKNGFVNQNNQNFNPYYPASSYSYSYYVPQYVPNPNVYNPITK